MTQEQFNEVLKANERLVEVKTVLNAFQTYDNCMLYLVYSVKDEYGNPHPNTLPYEIVPSNRFRILTIQGQKRKKENNNTSC